jgi:L-lactate dehydrogenase complex protein LldG
MSARDAIFASIRRSLGVTGSQGRVCSRSEARSRRRPNGSRPAFARSRALPTLAEVPRFPRYNNCPASVRMGADERLNAMPGARRRWKSCMDRRTIMTRTPVSMAFAGSAKRGHSFSFPGPLPDNHIFLPDNHIVVLGKTTSSQITKASS